MRAFLVIALTLSGWSEALPARRIERMVISKMRMADLESSGSGYAYDQRHGSPLSYVRYTDHGSGSYYASVPFVGYNGHGDGALPVPVAQAIPEIAVAERGDVVDYGNVEIGRGASSQPSRETSDVFGYAVPFAKAEPVAPYYPAGKLEITKYEKVEDDDDDDEDDEDDEDSSEEADDDDESDEDEDESHESGGGAVRNAEEYSASGEKGDNGYKKHYGFENGEKKKYDDEHQEGYYKDENGQKKGYEDESGESGEHAESEKSTKGGSHGRSSYHKKGEKTSGYHNVFRKDEYKKNTDFYDVEHDGGRYEKVESNDESRDAVVAGHRKGGSRESGRSERERERKGHDEASRETSSDVGRSDEEAAHAYRRDRIDYEKERKTSDERRRGYSAGGDYR